MLPYRELRSWLLDIPVPGCSLAFISTCKTRGSWGESPLAAGPTWRGAWLPPVGSWCPGVGSNRYPLCQPPLPVPLLLLIHADMAGTEP